MIIPRHEFRSMFESIRNDAISVHNNCSVLLLVAPDVDAICAARVLTSVFQQENIDFRVSSVAGYKDIRREFKRAEDEGGAPTLRSILMINCGASVPVTGQLFLGRVPDLVKVYILDFFRPVRHENIRDSENIFVFDLEGIDDLDELVPSDDDESEGIAALREEFENDDFDDGEFDVDADGDDGEDAPENDGGSAGAAAPDGGDGAEGASVESGGSPSGARKRRASGAPTAGSAGSDADPPESGASSPASGEGERRKRLRRRDADDASEGDDAVEPVKGFRQETLEATLRRARWTKLRRYDNYYDDGRLSEKTPAAFLAWELVKAACSSTRRDLLWFAIVGTTAQFLSEKLSRPRYDSLCVELKRDVISTAPVVIASDETGVDAARALAGREGLIEDEPFEPRFVAHRHWSLIESMRCSEYISTRLDTWKIPNMGEPSELDMLIAKTNTRVKVADASFAHVSRADRASFFQNLKRQISTNSRWRMHESELFYPSFTRNLGASEPVMSAADYVYALSGLLSESPDSSSIPAGVAPMMTMAVARHLNWKDAWQNAFQALSRKSTALLDRGIERTKLLRRAILRVIPNLLRGRRLRTGKVIRWIEIGEDLTDAERRMFAQPSALAELGRFIIRVYRDSLMEWRKKSGAVITLPLVISLRHKADATAAGGAPPDGSWVSVMGLPVLKEEGIDTGADSGLLFKASFMIAAQYANATYHLDSFSTDMMVIRAAHLLPFFRQIDQASAVGVVGT